MPITMTRAEYEAKYGIAPVIPKTSAIDTSVAPRRMTRAEYDAEYKPKEKSFFNPTNPDFLRFKADTSGSGSEIALAPLKSTSNLATFPARVAADVAVNIPVSAYQGAKEGIFTPENGLYGPTPFLKATQETVNKGFVKPIFDIASFGSNVLLGTFQAGVKKVTGYDLGDKEAEKALATVGEHLLNSKVEDTAKVAEFLHKTAVERPEDILLVADQLNSELSKVRKTPTDVVSSSAKPVMTVAEDLKTKYNDFQAQRQITKNADAVAKLDNEISNIQNNYSKTRKANEFSSDAGSASRKRIAETDVLVDAVDSNGLIRTKQPGGAVEKYIAQTIDGKEGVVRENLARNGEKVNLEQVKRDLITVVDKSGLEGGDLITALDGVKKEIKGLSRRADVFGDVPLEVVHDAKINTTKNINYNTPPETATYRKALARGYKTIVEENSKKFDVKPVNAELAKYYKDVKTLENLDGLRVKGGKLGKYTAQITGNIAGGAIGGAVGGLPGAAIGSVVGGEVSSALKGKFMGNTFGKERGVTAPENAILEKAKAEGKLPPEVDLTKPDVKVGANKTIPKTKEIYSLEKQIAKNIEAQKLAIKAGDFSLVSTLKEIYVHLVAKLKEIIQKYKDTPNKKGGFIKTGVQSSKSDIPSETGLQKLSQSFNDTTTNLKDAQVALREAKGLSASDIMSKHPDINLKRDVPVTDIYGKKSVIPEGEALTPYELKGNKVLLQDGETYIVSKNQYQNIKGNAVSGEAKPFAPELKGTEETVKANWKEKQAEIFAKKDEGLITKEQMNAELDKLGNNQSPTKYQQYQLPGGKNYKEVLIKAPLEGGKVTPNDVVLTKSGEGIYSVSIRGEKVADTYPRRAELANNPNAEQLLKKEYADKFNGNKMEGVTGGFKSSHWEEPNVISHLRLNERTYQGKPVTFMEEIQSDWAREARKAQIDNAKPVPNDENFVDGNPPWEGYGKNQTPTHPLLKNWQELSVKRALKEAVDNNSEYLAWINGEQTSARYNLATQVENVKWEIDDSSSVRKANGGKNIIIEPKDGKSPFNILVDKDGTITSAPGSTEGWKGKKLDEVIGKGLADKIMEKETGTLSGEGLKFGGEWANNLYDKQIPNIIKDLTGQEPKVIDMGLPVDKGKAPDFHLMKNGNTTEKLTAKNLKIGSEISDEVSRYSNNSYIITDVLGDGKFKAVKKSNIVSENIKSLQKTGKLINPDGITNGAIQTFDISTKKSAGQQAIKITPEIRAMVKGEAIPLKKPSGVSPIK